jgi:hypothetical protein
MPSGELTGSMNPKLTGNCNGSVIPMALIPGVYTFRITAITIGIIDGARKPKMNDKGKH